MTIHEIEFLKFANCYSANRYYHLSHLPNYTTLTRSIQVERILDSLCSNNPWQTVKRAVNPFLDGAKVLTDLNT